MGKLAASNHHTSQETEQKQQIKTAIEDSIVMEMEK